MEGNFPPETSKLPTAESMDFNHELTRSNSIASSLAAKNCKDILRRSENVKPGRILQRKEEITTLNSQLLKEKQILESKSLLAEWPEQSQGRISQNLLINVNSASEQINVSENGCWQNLKWVKAEPLYSGTSIDLRASLKSNWMCNSKRIHFPPPPAEMPKYLTLCSTVKQGKEILSHGLATFSLGFSSNNPCNWNLSDLTREGIGQNFLDADNQSTCNFESKTKRSKTARADSSIPDQFVPSGEYPRADFAVINSSLSEKD